MVLQLVSKEFQQTVDERKAAKGITAVGYHMVPHRSIPDCRVFADKGLGVVGRGRHALAL